MLDATDNSSFQGASQFVNALLLICENMCINYRALVILGEPIMNCLIPVLFHKVQNCENGDMKFLSFKIYTDIITQYV